MDVERRRAYNKAWRDAHPEYARHYRETHRAEFRAYGVMQYATHRDQHKAEDAAHYAAHRDEIKAKRATFRAERPGHRRLYNNVYRATHPEQEREGNARRRIRRAAAEVCTHPACLSLGPVQLAWQTNPHRCYLCGVPVSSGNLHMDHVIPIARGGIHCAENLRPACRDCNLRKGARAAGGSFPPPAID